MAGVRPNNRPIANQNFNRYFRQSNIMPSAVTAQQANKQSAARTRRAVRDPKSPGMRGPEMRSIQQAQQATEDAVGSSHQRKPLSTLEL